MQAAITKIVYTGWLIKEQKFISNTWRQEVQGQGARMVRLCEYPLLCCRLLISVSSQSGEQREEASSFLTLIRALIPFTRTPPSWLYLILITSQRPHLLVLSHEGAGFQHTNFVEVGGTQTFSPQGNKIRVIAKLVSLDLSWLFM